MVRPRRTLWVVAPLLLAVATVVTAHSLAATRPAASAAAPSSGAGKLLYRRFCGQCHALAPALSAGFGSAGSGLGGNGGPSFNDLRVPFQASVTAVAEPTGGHAQVKKKITWSELLVVANYIAKATSHNLIPALPTDG
jgi:mono/diheme cytochrome c family protein